MTNVDPIHLARTVIDKYGADADKPSVHLARALLDSAHERDAMRPVYEAALAWRQRRSDDQRTLSIDAQDAALRAAVDAAITKGPK